jgi:hypothetical protein
MADPANTSAQNAAPANTAAPAQTQNTSENPTGSENPNTSTQTPPAQTAPSAQPAADPSSKPNETAPSSENKPAEQNQPPPADILELAKSGEEKEAQAKEQAKADFDAYVKDAGLKDGITDVVVQKGENGKPDVTLPAQEVGAIFSVLKATGIPADKARDMLGMVSALDQFRAAAQQKRDEQVLNEIRTEAAKEFGDNLTTAARDMVAGGQRLFGAELWKDICTIPALVNDKRFIRAMSAYGRSGRNDTGGPAPTSGGATGGKIVFDLDAFSKGTI